MPSSLTQVSTHVPRHSLYSLSDSSDCDPDNKAEEDSSRHLTPLEKLTLDMCHDEKTIKELNVGRRVGFYKVCCEIGCGNFSKVKLAFHALTKGRWDTFWNICAKFYLFRSIYLFSCYTDTGDTWKLSYDVFKAKVQLRLNENNTHSEEKDVHWRRKHVKGESCWFC